MKSRILEVTHSQYSLAIQDAIFARPIFSSLDFVKRVGIKPDTAKALLSTLKSTDIVRELIPRQGRIPARLVFWRLVNITEGKSIFKDRPFENL